MGLAAIYIAARRAGLASHEAALIKMPTGAGKTAVIATLACALPGIKRTLVITPRRSLVDQVHADLHVRFWSRFDHIYDGKTVRPRQTADRAVGGPRRSGPVWHLLPKAARTLTKITSDRIVLAGTFTALEQILRPERPAHRLSGTRARGEEAIASDVEIFAGVDDAALNKLATFLRGFDLVVVDESHYEPAYAWSQCIRSLGLPTVLFSATSYRNDFKYFAISGRFAFNLSYQEAQRNRLIRPVKLVTGEELGAKVGDDFLRRLELFEREKIKAQSRLPAKLTPKRIVRVDDHASIVRLQKQIRGRLKERRCSHSLSRDQQNREAPAQWIHYRVVSRSVDPRPGRTLTVCLTAWLQTGLHQRMPANGGALSVDNRVGVRRGRWRFTPRQVLPQR